MRHLLDKWALLNLKNQFGCKKKEKGSKRGKNMREREREREGERERECLKT